MATRSTAQEEFDNLVSRASKITITHHRDDDLDYAHDREHSDLDEEDEYQKALVEGTMRMPALNSGALHLPHREFDQGRTTGVKGVIADARSYEEARRNGSWRNKFSRSRSTSAEKNKRASTISFLRDDGDSDDEEFLESWREQRREELTRTGSDIRNRRTSPSCRRYGHFDDVDALGYLDAIERVGRDTIIVVVVVDPECPVSQVITDALIPLVSANPTVHFVKVHYEDIEFDNAGVPAILAYKNQGDLFANLTYIIDQIPDNTEFDTAALRDVLKKHNIL
ncbi:thioredoxin-like protein [Calycina marina]|uniref:Thioredoxin-like protein n=1 Tax=Calycina marina TaxID=1763456 RepID=A0A9P7YZQ4_9HELO|nr:thioredoxin-like protein [Calycina marina]